ncbi:SAM-dependent methyltransferase [Nitrosophilus kaiyonis]|uniref:SAM-dependent methyltransferase n=1 Tax=Nitrosophilus kaiyonis TaxID=2930200 RepID=UPI00248F978D|nr:SAM-dependent methyltransferase [Nitrosophilus kaiyonis]
MVRFSKFMQEWLYAYDGYYANFKAIGKEGDFYTAVSVSKFFGGAIANHLIKLIENGVLSKDCAIFEIGAHQGYLLADIIEFIYTLKPELLKTLSFNIIEPFENLRKTQEEYFKQSFGDVIKLNHYKSLKEVNKKEAFVVANEIFDAFPCELIFKGKMAYVDDFKIVWKEMNKNIEKIASKYHQIKGEVAIGYEEFAKDMANAFEKCYFLTFDYGDLEVREDFSIRVYKEHKVYPLFDEELNLKEVYKKSDITYDVNFSYLIDSFENAGFKKDSFKTQLVALVDFGILDLLEIVKEKKGFNAYLREANKVKTLINPTMMGERFKMASFIK